MAGQEVIVKNTSHNRQLHWNREWKKVVTIILTLPYLLIMSFLYCRRESVFVEGFVDLEHIFGGLH